jgi:hypothetical protein
MTGEQGNGTNNMESISPSASNVKIPIGQSIFEDTKDQR